MLLFVSCPDRSTFALGSVPESRSLCQHFLWSWSFPPGSPLPFWGFVRALLWYYDHVRLPSSVHVRYLALAFPDRPQANNTPAGATGISRFPCQKCPHMLRVSGPAESTHNSPFSSCIMLSSPTHQWVDIPKLIFGTQYLGLCFPLSTLHQRPYERWRMTRGHGGWLRLSV